MRIVTAEQMRALDRAAIEKHGIPSQGLMERAGMGLAESVLSLVGTSGGSVMVIAGAGNNGGDGLVAARLIDESGADVNVVILAEKDELSPDAAANLEKLTDVEVAHVGDEAAFDEAVAELGKPDIIVDAIFGTGLAREVTGLPRHAVEFINSSDTGIISADIPSGLSADSGEVLGVAVKADCTVTFGLPKVGFFAGDGPDHAGCVSVIDIGIPKDDADAIGADLELVESCDIIDAFPRRKKDSHKGNYGHVVVFAGSGGHLGAGYLTSLAALRTGSGLVTYCIPEGAFDKFDARYPEIMCDAIPDGGNGAFAGVGLEKALQVSEGKRVVAMGPAIGTSEETAKFVNGYILKSDATVVIDADGINVLDIDALEKRHAPAVLTPHPGEMARLMGVETKEVQEDRVGFARSLADRTGAVVVLKGSMTVVAEPRGTTSINTTGNPGMATAGMGDALTGMIASLIGQKVDEVTAARAAVFIHGLAGDIAADELGEESVVATDVIERIGRAIETTRNASS